MDAERHQRHAPHRSSGQRSRSGVDARRPERDHQLDSRQPRGSVSRVAGRSPRRAPDASRGRPRHHAEHLARRQIGGLCRADAAAPATSGISRFTCSTSPAARSRALDAPGGTCWPTLVARWQADRERRACTPSRRGCRSARPPASSRASCVPIRSGGITTRTGRRTASWIAFSVSPQHHQGEDWDLADRRHRRLRLPPPDHRPRQRPSPRLEAVKGSLALPFRRRASHQPSALRYDPCVSPRAPSQFLPRSSSPAATRPRRPRRSTSSRRARATTTPVDAYCGTLKVFENRDDQTGPTDRSEHRRAAGAQRRSQARSVLLPRRRAGPGRGEDGQAAARDVPADR